MTFFELKEKKSVDRHLRRAQVLNRQAAGDPKESSLLCASAPLREEIFKVFSIQRVMPRIDSALPVLLYSQLLDRQDAGAPKEALCASVPLRDKTLKVFSAQNVMPHRRAALL